MLCSSDPITATQMIKKKKIRFSQNGRLGKFLFPDEDSDAEEEDDWDREKGIPVASVTNLLWKQKAAL